MIVYFCSTWAIQFNLLHSFAGFRLARQERSPEAAGTGAAWHPHRTGSWKPPSLARWEACRHEWRQASCLPVSAASSSAPLPRLQAARSLRGNYFEPAANKETTLSPGTRNIGLFEVSVVTN